ncbi:DUF6266 family protein [Chitinophaga filiformis]|uniref:DUF6266 family protein n=1 Tax=Chitinophaga filiformis TaxID=104663 RepID=A0ABY4HU30_CHIFI|nr:DUF6266 family protein [Chitinophaga filiformis]UPK67295.1 DUF6266 family protein [Chitinophaga filiformis]
MARLKKGLLNGFSGMIGNAVGYELKGQYILRSRPKKSTKPPTEKQLACRAKMRIINSVLNGFSPFVKIGFAATAKDQTFTPYNAAVAYQLNHAITGSYPNYEIDYSKLRVTEGVIITDDLHPTVFLQGDTLLFNWTPAIDYPAGTDHVMLLAYAPALGQAVYNLCGAKRRTGQDVLQLPQSWRQQKIKTYLAFRSETSSMCSNSLYLGTV